MRTALAIGLLTCISAGCARLAEPALAARSADELAELRTWLTGAWRAAESGIEESWSAVGEVLAGVGFTVSDHHTTSYEVMLIHRDGPRSVLTALAGGVSSVDFGAVKVDAGHARFANPGHDHPQAIDYRVDGAGLRIERRGQRGRSELTLAPTARARAAELEGQDRAFAADSDLRGGAAWAVRFSDDGAMWPRGGARRQGPAEIAQALDGLADRGLRLQWTPSASGLSPAGDLGFTAGPYRLVRTDGTTAETGCYVRIWRRDRGGWRIVFDTGASNHTP